MKITTLIENTAVEGFLCEHGLSVYVETAKHRLIVDTGQSDAFLENAAALGIDLTQVDTLVLSHGHYDHAGGIMGFGKRNPHAKIWMQREASGDQYHGERYIGIDKDILKLPQVRLLDGDLQLDEELSLFTGITGRRHFPKDNLNLTRIVNGQAVLDDFCHEQCLVIAENGEYTLISGCAHNGILNILDKFRALYGCDPVRVISVFHMRKKTPYDEDDLRQIKAVAHELLAYDTQFFTGHCTGDAFPYLKEIMGERVTALCSGTRIL
jgi:7,8-dihydropterin-6-yl-methyl-4-(beta-D-ribofuranosyl)aminobenzene 5'-phosphate synthase